MLVQSVGINMPRDFPTTAYNAVHARVARIQPDFPEAFLQYGGAWNSVAYRFHSCAKADQSFRSQLLKPKTVIGRYREEKALFEFFSCAYSTLDSFAYGLHGLCNITDATSFPFTASALRAITLKQVATRLTTVFPNEALGPKLSLLITDPIATELHELRNVLSHRASSTRKISLYVGSNQPDEDLWVIGHLQLKSGLKELSIDKQSTAKYRRWLARQLSTLLPDVTRFIEANLPATK